MSISKPDVGVAIRAGANYPAAPFDPPELYPEFRNSRLSGGPFNPANHVYALVREALFRHLGGYNVETKQVDLSVLRRLGNVRKIVIKPNWVRQQNGLGNCVVTHGSVLRPLIDYFLLAFGSTSDITVADIPLQSSDIHQIWAETGIDVLSQYYHNENLPVQFRDFRREKAVIDSSGFILRRESLPGDPLGYAEVSLGSQSHLEAICDSKSVFSVNDYEPGIATCYHRAGQHSYLIPKTVLAAELFVNVPKLKTHCKAGITVCMKNLIGINGEKGWIPHFRMGAPKNNGDEYPNRSRHIMNIKTQIQNSLQEHYHWAYNISQFVWKTYKHGWETIGGGHLTSGGAWPGNDTLWRSILDLVRVITVADPHGRVMEMPQRHHLCVVDGIVCGEGEGPLEPSPRPVGLILCASNPVSVDWTAAHIVGFDWMKIAQLSYARQLNQLWQDFPERPEDLTASWSGADPGARSMVELPVFPLKPPAGWVGYVEADHRSNIFRKQTAISLDHKDLS
jgi:uncharacterized protein (DUF362 family)